MMHPAIFEGEKETSSSTWPIIQMARMKHDAGTIPLRYVDGMEEMSLEQFKSMSDAVSINAYVSALEAFDSAEQIQELKAVERQRNPRRPGLTALDVGCGFGLETLRLAEALNPSGSVTGLDASPGLLNEARKRAKRAGLPIAYLEGDAKDLPFPGNSFDLTRAERVLIYIDTPERALSEMLRVTKPGGRIALIEPAFASNAINHPNQDLTAKILRHEVETSVRHPELPPQLMAWVKDQNLHQVRIDTRVVIFPQSLAHSYYSGVGQKALDSRLITADALTEWRASLDALLEAGTLFATIGYFLFTMQV